MSLKKEGVITYWLQWNLFLTTFLLRYDNSSDSAYFKERFGAHRMKTDEFDKPVNSDWSRHQDMDYGST